MFVKPNQTNRFKLKKTFIEKVQESKPVTKTLRVFFLTILALFLMDFGFIHGKRRTILIKNFVIFILVTLFCSYCVICVFKIDHNIFRVSWRLKVIIQHFSFVLILLFSSSIKFRNLLEKLHEIDLKIEIGHEKFHLEYKIIGYFLISAVTNIALVLLSWAHFSSNKINMALEIPNLLMEIASDVPLIINFFVFSSIYLRVRNLKKFLKRKVFFDDKVIGDKTIILYSHRIYMSLVDLTESVKGTYDYIFLLSTILSIPNILAVIYAAIRDMKSDSQNSFHSVECVMVIHIIVIKFAPAFAAGSLSTAAHQIKILLHKKLIEEKDPEKVATIWKFLNYIDTRSFRLQVFTVVPLDASLLMKILGLCSTYVIVLIQLTHLY